MKLMVIIKEHDFKNTIKLRKMWRDFHVFFFGVPNEEIIQDIGNEKAKSLYFDGERHVGKLDRDYLLISDESEMFEFVKDTFNFEYLLYTNVIYPMDFEPYYHPNRIIKIKGFDSYIIPCKLINTPLDKNMVIDISRVIDYDGSKVVSLGGWCGPAVGIMNIQFKIKQESYPFDWGHVSVSAVNRLIRNNFKDYLPNDLACTPKDIEWRNKEKAVRLGIAHKECFTNEKRDVLFVHSGMNDEKERIKWKNRSERFMNILNGDYVTFIRTVTHSDYKEELKQIEILKETLKQLFPQLHYKLVLIFHDQDIGTTQLDPIDENTMVWAVDGIVGWAEEYQNHLYHNYRRIIEFSLDESNWPPKADIKNHTIVNHREHWNM